MMSATRPEQLLDESRRDPARIHEFDFLRATECAALNTLKWLGKGDKESADAAACDAIRGMFDIMNIRGEVVIGEGIKDQHRSVQGGESRPVEGEHASF